jgi:diguanylate cyclase (GGDEF)-like protein
VSTSRRRWPRHFDHYYWLTAYLAARDMQTRTCRLVATIILGLGAIPSTLMMSSVGPDGLQNRLLAGVITVCCVVMGVLWLRHCWPTRTQSRLCVVVGTVCIAVACLIEDHPVIGLLGSTAFAVLSAFTAFFHSARLLALTWTVGVATLGVLALRLATIDAALAVCSVVLIALVNVFVAFPCRTITRLIDTEILHGQIEPLTGLLNRDGFYDHIATLIGARRRDDDRYLIVLVVNLDSFSLLTAMTGAPGGNRVAIGQRLRETVRRDAIIAHIGDAEFFIADLFTTPDPFVLTERIRGTVRTAPFRLTASIGAVSTPLPPLASYPPHDVCEELLTIATTAMYEARKAGGNQARHVPSPALAVLDDLDSQEDWPDIDRSA